MAFKINENILKFWEIELQKKLSLPASALMNPDTERSRQKVLYHYTNLSGLKGIVENQCFYLSNSTFLNDKEEFLYGIALFKAIAEDLLTKKMFKGNEYLIRKIVDELSKIAQSNRYVTCFSFEGDLLSQWRAYSDDGKGIAIGFDLQKLKEAFRDNAEGFFIVYDRNRQQKIAFKVLKMCLSFYCKEQKKRTWGKASFNKVVPEEILKLIDKYIGQFKHSSFIEENEYRFEIRIDEDVQNGREILFRINKNGLLVPYLSLQTIYKDEKDRRIKEGKVTDDLEKGKQYRVKRLPITEVIIGPSTDYALNRQSIMEFLKKYDYKDVEIKRSNVPYRI